MSFYIRNIAADEPDGTPTYLGIPVGTGTYHNMRKELADSFATREEAEAVMTIAGKFIGAAYLRAEDGDEDPIAAAQHFAAVLISAVQKCENILPRSAEIPGVDPINLEEMSVLRVAIAMVKSNLGLGA